MERAPFDQIHAYIRSLPVQSGDALLSRTFWFQMSLAPTDPGVHIIRNLGGLWLQYALQTEHPTCKSGLVERPQFWEPCSSRWHWQREATLHGGTCMCTGWEQRW